jgi:hypothetical protein
MMLDENIIRILKSRATRTSKNKGQDRQHARSKNQRKKQNLSAPELL